MGRGPTAVEHVQSIAVVESRLSAEVGITDWLAVAAMVPVRVFDAGIRYVDGAGQEVTLTAPNIHHRDERLTGVADPWLLVRGARDEGGWGIEWRGGLTLPVGATEEDPFVLGEAGRPHQHVQFGTGTPSPIAGVDLVGHGDGFELRLWGLTIQSVSRNPKGYQAGDRYAVGMAAASALGTTRWGFAGGLEAQLETSERWGGVVYADDGNRGRVDALGMAAATVRLGRFEISATVRAPFLTHVVGGQLEYPFVVGLGVGTSFDLAEPETVKESAEPVLAGGVRDQL